MSANTSTVALPDAAVYARTRDRLIDVARGLSPSDAGREVSTCPGWTVKDVVSHLTGIAADVLAGRLDGLGSPAWTEAQVVARRGRTIAAVCGEWAELGPAFEALMEDQPPIALAAAADVVMHEIDIDAALGRAGDRSSVDVRAAARRYAELAVKRVDDAGHGPIAIRTEEGDELTGGVGAAELSVRAPAFDLLLSLTGRRTEAEIRALPWSGDPGPLIGLLSPYGPLPEEAVV